MKEQGLQGEYLLSTHSTKYLKKNSNALLIFNFNEKIKMQLNVISPKLRNDGHL